MLEVTGVAVQPYPRVPGLDGWGIVEPFPAHRHPRAGAVALRPARGPVLPALLALFFRARPQSMVLGTRSIGPCRRWSALDPARGPGSVTDCSSSGGDTNLLIVDTWALMGRAQRWMLASDVSDGFESGNPNLSDGTPIGPHGIYNPSPRSQLLPPSSQRSACASDRPRLLAIWLPSSTRLRTTGPLTSWGEAAVFRRPGTMRSSFCRS